MAKPETFFSKVWRDHEITLLGEDLALLQIDRLILHELSGSQALRALTEGGREPDSRGQVFTVIEHLISTRPGRGPNESVSISGPAMIDGTRKASKHYGFHFIDYNDSRQGIAHVVAPELGIALPGTTLVCCDSHTCTVGGIGALAWGIGASEAEHVLATQTLAQPKPKTMRISFDGHLPDGVYAKDLILALIGKIGANGGIGYAVEFAGPVIRKMPIEGRLTLCNMAIEFSAKFGFVPPDEITIEYLSGLEFVPSGDAWESAVSYWLSLRTDADALFDAEVHIDCSQLTPQVTWGNSPQHVSSINAKVPDPSLETDMQARDAAEQALTYMHLKAGMPILGIPIDIAYIGSCTNARLSDLRIAAAVIKGLKVKSGVQAICIPGSTGVKNAAEAEGLDKIFIDAGFEWHASACGFCGHIGDDRFADLRVISTTNRNFKGRQGPNTRTHLASPATVAASAIAGCIASAKVY
jgi:3-isopropylmalate/(R)-2-methylmalate dehydratase large subunit